MGSSNGHLTKTLRSKIERLDLNGTEDCWESPSKVGRRMAEGEGGG